MQAAVSMAMMSAGAFLLLLGSCRTQHPAEELRYSKVTMAIVARVDLDHDGRVSSDEYTQLAFPDEPMDRWDTDRDGSLDPKEIEATFLDADPVHTQAEGRHVLFEKYGDMFGQSAEPAPEGKGGRQRGQR
jgi:hypothetical protein